mmetsp:Transcript_25077/g.41305  ORF Transcript_25077/g.41305 Transcript_25077/m.41305 type:complete len:326 (-) Transcript_25077:123-1100(-)
MSSVDKVTLICKTAADFSLIQAWLNEQAWYTSGSTSVNLTSASEYEKPKEADQTWFDFRSYFSSLKTSSFGRTVVYGHELTSTQHLIRESFGGFPAEGLLALANRQTAGKGRGGNTWTSPFGCLMFSLCFKETEGLRVPLLQYLVSLSIVTSVNKRPDFRGVKLQIKWPNDIYANGLKVGGILCQSTYRDGVFEVTAGVGINVTNDEPTTSLVSLSRNVGNDVKLLSRESVLSGFLNDFESRVGVFRTRGFLPYKKEYLDNWLHTNQQVVTGTEQEGQKTIRIVGLTDAGYLLGETLDRTEKFELHPDGNSLDFFAGLIRKKTQS